MAEIPAEDDPNVESTFRATIVVEFKAWGKRHAYGHLHQIVNYGVEAIRDAKVISSEAEIVP